MRLAWLLLLCVMGCGPVVTELDSDLAPVADPLLEAASSEAKNLRPVVAQPEPYARIIQQNLDEVAFRFDGNLRNLEIERLRTQQSRLPSFSPGASLRSTGALVLELGVQQVIYSGARFRAEFHDSNIRAVARQLELLEQLSRDASTDLEAYLSYHRNLELEAMLADLVDRLAALEELAQRRNAGGIGSADEVALFVLKRTEVETERQIAQSDAAVDLASLKGLDVSAPPVAFATHSEVLPLDILTALAKSEEAASALQLARQGARPQLTVEMSAGIDLKTGLPSTGANLSVDTKPLNIGGDTEIMLAEHRAFLAQNELQETATRIDRERQKLSHQIDALLRQAEQTDILVMQAQDRFDAFSDRFLAGSASLTEAVSLIDTLRRSLASDVDVRYRIFELQRALAELNGAFWVMGQGGS